MLKDKNKKIIYVVLVVLVMVNVLAWVAVWEMGQSEDLEVVFFDDAVDSGSEIEEIIISLSELEVDICLVSLHQNQKGID